MWLKDTEDSMKLEIINDVYKELSVTFDYPQDYATPQDCKIIERIENDNVQKLFIERKRIHIDGLFLDFYTRSFTEDQKLTVKTDFPYIQIHFEISGGATYYYPHCRTHIELLTDEGEFTIFYVPALNGKLLRPACDNAFCLQIEISKRWLVSHLSDRCDVATRFMKAIQNNQSVILGGRNFPITRTIKHILMEVYHCKFENNIKQLFIEGKLFELLSLIIDMAGSTVGNDTANRLSKQEKERLYAIKDLLEQDYHKRYTIQELSEMSFMNRTKMQNAFKQLFGNTIHGFIIEKRMVSALELLSRDTTEKVTISEIANKLGYRHYSHFSTMFKKYFGYSPRDNTKQS